MLTLRHPLLINSAGLYLRLMRAISGAQGCDDGQAQYTHSSDHHQSSATYHRSLILAHFSRPTPSHSDSQTNSRGFPTKIPRS